MSQVTFLNYKGYRWVWITAVGLLACTIWYVIDDPVGGRNGGTIVGYTYGTLAALLILFLTWYGVRKRSYRSTTSTVQGWLAAHIWLGLGLLLLVPLHAGFSFGWNVHTLAYVLMVIVILSGIWGAFNYSSLSHKIASHRGGAKTSQILEQMLLLSSDLERLTAAKSDQFLKLVHECDFTFRPSLATLFGRSDLKPVDSRRTSELLSAVPESEREEALKAVSIIDQKADVAALLIDEVKIKALLKFWLYMHVPLTMALLAALTIHIVSVFYYW